MSGFKNEAEGYAESLRQQAKWIDGSVFTDDLDSDELRAAADFIERAIPAWQPIATAPKDGMSIDLWCRNISAGSTGQTRFADMFINGDGKWEDWHGYVLEPKWRPTHWQPLPTPPEVQS